MSVLQGIVDRYGKQKYLTASLFFFLFADAFFPPGASGNELLMMATLTTMIITGPLAVARKPWHSRTVIGLAALMVIPGVTGIYIDKLIAHQFSMVMGIAFFAMLIVMIVRERLILKDSVSAETLWAAVNVYALMGLLFRNVYALAVTINPDAFKGAVQLGAGSEVSFSLLYFSFVTMTTLGYGDITPNSSVVGMFAYMQALIGQL